MNPTLDQLQTVYGPTVRYIPAWALTLGTEVVMTRAIDKAAPLCSKVVSVGNNNRVVTYRLKNNLGASVHENSLVLVWRDGK